MYIKNLNTKPTIECCLQMNASMPAEEKEEEEEDVKKDFFTVKPMKKGLRFQRNCPLMLNE
jgi:hypothetical protein